VTVPGPRIGHDFVRPFIMTNGRTRADRRDLRLETMLRSAVADIPAGLPSEQAAILSCCREPSSVAEVSAALGLVVGVVAVVACDLVEAGLLEVHHTDPVEIQLDVLHRMIERVRAL
jgi:hypothetical protein